MSLALVGEPPQERRGLDYATLIFNAMEPRAFMDTFSEIISIFEVAEPSLGFSENGRDQHYERVFSNELHCRISFTEPDSFEGRNKGQICLNLPGSFFYLLPESTFADAFTDFTRCKWFSHFTRLDFQNTELNPSVNAEQMLEGVAAGRYWVKGAKRWRQWAERNAAQELTDGVTIYWGSARSEKLGRSYDKAKQKPHWDVPAVRDEVQVRGKWARVHGDHLVRDLADCKTPRERLDVMQKNATFALSQHLMYFELGDVPASDKNWIRKAKKADWYVQRIGKASRPLKRPADEKTDIERATDAGVRQFGAIFAKWVHTVTQASGATEEEVTALLLARCKAALKPEDFDYLYPKATKRDRKEWLAHLSEVKNDVALGQEHGWLAEPAE